jgi:hypothetical protein
MARFKRIATMTLACSTTLVIAVNGVAAPAANAGTTVAGRASVTTPRLTYQQIAALSPVEQAKVMNPYREAAGALDEYGRAGGAGIYSGVEIDAPNGAVHLYLTDTARMSGSSGPPGPDTPDRICRWCRSNKVRTRSGSWRAPATESPPTCRTFRPRRGRQGRLHLDPDRHRPREGRVSLRRRWIEPLARRASARCGAPVPAGRGSRPG